MIIKKFQAETEDAAILQAKEELGNNAVVVNIKTLKPRGIMGLFKKPTVEVTAALEEKDNVQDKIKPAAVQDNAGKDMIKAIDEIRLREERKQQHESTQKETVTRVKKGERNPYIKQLENSKEQVSKDDKELEKKLESLQQLLEENLSKKEEVQVPEVEEEETEIEIYAKLIYNKLLEYEVDEKYANMIIDEIDKNVKSEASLDYVISTVYQKMILKLGEPKPIKLTQKKPKIVFFIGPTGVGKTTTIAKIASKFSLEDKCKVAMLTADTYRIAATDQLETYAKILNVPFKVVYTPEEIKTAVKDFEDYDLILVDTAGHSHQNEKQLSDTKKLTDSIEDGEQKEIFLVLSATTKYRDLLRIVDSYKEIPGYKLIFTKLDETTYYGNILNIRMYTDADLSYLTCGQNVPDDIEKIDSQKIVKQLLGGN